MWHLCVVMVCQTAIVLLSPFSSSLTCGLFHMQILSLLFLLSLMVITILKLLHLLPTSYSHLSLCIHTLSHSRSCLLTFSSNDVVLSPSLFHTPSFSPAFSLRLLGPLISPITCSNNCCLDLSSEKDCLLVRKSARVVEAITRARVGVQMHGFGA